MSEFDIEFLSQKLSENPQSPLFARLADLFLQKEQYSEALKLCEEGIQQFPKYYAGYLVLGKVCLALKEYSTARDAFEHALDLSPFNELTAKLFASVPAQPDESVRTSDETYFEPQQSEAESHSTTQLNSNETQFEQQPPALSVEEQIAQQFAQQSAQQFTHREEPAVEEMGFSHAIQEPPITQPPAVQEIIDDQNPQPAPQPEKRREQETLEMLSASAAPKFPSFDEYYSQRSPNAQSGAVSTLDEYLGGNGSSAPAAVQEEYSSTYAEPVQEFSEPSLEAQEPAQEAAVEQHQIPEPVFTSPEQAQLFAEMTAGTTVEEEKPGPEPKTTIDDLAEKLQKVERIIPQEMPPLPPVIEETPEDHAAESEMVTPTLAEIYASQGEYGAAIQAYEILMFSHPGKTAEYQQRIRELQKKQLEKEGLM